MPSGAKKRKQAKKKNLASHSVLTSSSVSHSQSGNDDLKHHDQRASDGGYGEELEKREDSPSTRSFVSEGKSNHGESTGKADDEDGVVEIEWNMKPKEDYRSRDIAIGSEKKSSDRSSSENSSSSGSDDESHFVEKKIVVVEDALPVVDFVEDLNSFPEKVTWAVDSLVKPTNPFSEGVAQVDESSLVGEENKTASTHEIESVSIENGSPSHLIESYQYENGMKILPSLDKHSEISSVPMDLGLKSEDKVKTTSSLGSVQYSGPSSDAKVLVAEETNTRPSNVEESETPRYTDNQPSVASTLGVVEKTSWKSCCGIFELFTGSNK